MERLDELGFVYVEDGGDDGRYIVHCLTEERVAVDGELELSYDGARGFLHSDDVTIWVADKFEYRMQLEQNASLIKIKKSDGSRVAIAWTPSC
eukprot:7129368-Lingulodinium_polyedra.AAC.1